MKRRVGYLPDSVGFYDNLTARQNLRYTARLAGIRRARRSRIASSDGMKRVRLDDVADNRVGTFSRGMKQRLGPCRGDHETRRGRDPRRADLRPRSASDVRAPGHDPRPQGRRRRRAALLASARPGAGGVRSRRAVQSRQDRARRHGRRSWRSTCSAAAISSRSKRVGDRSHRGLRRHRTACCASPTTGQRQISSSSPTRDIRAELGAAIVASAPAR